MENIPEPLEFEWDKGNQVKNFLKHKVTNEEAEQAFICESKLIIEDSKHSHTEKRYLLWGTTAESRKLTVIFTIRAGKIRVISARDMNHREKKTMKKQKKFKLIPQFKNEDEERKFWDKADTSLYFDWSKARRVVFPNLKPTTKSISLRLPQSMLNGVKVLANKRDVPYQSLIKIFIAEKLKEETHLNY